MEEIKAPELTGYSSALFQVPLLPFHTLATSVVQSEGVEGQGFGFAPDRKLAELKSHAEAVERWVFQRWRLTQVSPFTREYIPPPPGTSGFAAAPTSELARSHAFLEWHERASLMKVAQGALSIKEVAPANLGVAFRTMAGVKGIQLRSFASAKRPYFSISFVNYEKGVLFGSSSANSWEDSLLASALECIKKLAFAKTWKASMSGMDTKGQFISTAKFWLSDEGDRAFRRFIEGGIGVRNSEAGAARFQPEHLSEVKAGDFYIAYYRDPSAPLPELGDLRVPLL